MRKNKNKKKGGQAAAAVVDAGMQFSNLCQDMLDDIVDNLLALCLYIDLITTSTLQRHDNIICACGVRLEPQIIPWQCAACFLTYSKCFVLVYLC